MTKGGSLGVEGKGKAPHWQLTELGYMNELPTRDFERWNGKKFTDQKTKPRAPFPSYSAQEMAHTQMREMAHANRRNRDGNGAHTAAADSAEVRHIPSSTTPPGGMGEPAGGRAHALPSSAEGPSGDAPNGAASGRSEGRRRQSEKNRERSEQVSDAAHSERAGSPSQPACSDAGGSVEAMSEAKYEAPAASGVSKRSDKPSKPVGGNGPMQRVATDPANTLWGPSTEAAGTSCRYGRPDFDQAQGPHVKPERKIQAK